MHAQDKADICFTFWVVFCHLATPAALQFHQSTWFFKPELCKRNNYVLEVKTVEESLVSYFERKVGSHFWKVF